MPLPAFLITALKAAPQIAAAAVGVRNTLKKMKVKPKPSSADNAQKSIEELRSQLQELKTHSESQAEVVSQMAAQVETLSESVQFLSRRISLMNLAIFGNAAVAVVALVLAIL